MINEVTALRQRIEKLEVTLRFYADERCYEPSLGWDSPSDIQTDGGQLAREALNEPL